MKKRKLTFDDYVKKYERQAQPFEMSEEDVEVVLSKSLQLGLVTQADNADGEPGYIVTSLGKIMWGALDRMRHMEIEAIRKARGLTEREPQVYEISDEMDIDALADALNIPQSVRDRVTEVVREIRDEAITEVMSRRKGVGKDGQTTH